MLFVEYVLRRRPISVCMSVQMCVCAYVRTFTHTLHMYSAALALKLEPDEKSASRMKQPSLAMASGQRPAAGHDGVPGLQCLG